MKSRDVETLTHSLIRYAARIAPADLSARLEEEWLADLAAQRTGFARLRFAIGCYWATRVIAHEYLAPALATAETAGGSRTLVALAPSPSSFYSSRTTVLFFIAGLHIILIYCLAIGVEHNLAKSPPPPLQGVILDQPRPREILSNTSDPSLTSKYTQLPPVEIDPHYPPETDVPEKSDGIAETFPPQISKADTSTVNRVLGGPGRGFPNTDDYYPQTSRRLAEHGAAIVRVCVDERGHLTSEPTIANSSGSANLDEGALRLARDGSGHYRSTTEDGRPVNSCYPFRIRFELRR
jgi:TonB family protein